jgi:hypothetical protein
MIMPHMNKAPSLLVRARALTGFAELVSDLGGDADGLLRDVGMTTQMLAQPEATISMPATVALLENAASQLAAPDFGLLLAQRQDFSALGPIALVARRADTVGKALVAIARNLPYHVARTSLRMQAGPAEDSPGCVTNCLRNWRSAAAIGGDVLPDADPDATHAQRRCRR